MADPTEKFWTQLAKYLTHDQGKKSILLEMGDGDAMLWASVLHETPLRGYLTAEEATAKLIRWSAPGRYFDKCPKCEAPVEEFWPETPNDPSAVRCTECGWCV